MRNIIMLVAIHKSAWYPQDEMYMPLFVGAEGKEKWADIACDNTGDNISKKNPYYAELTGLYWAWKNLDCEYIGLSHYRRFFDLNFFLKTLKYKQKSILKKRDIDKLLDKADIVLPELGNFKNDTIRSHYERSHIAQDLVVAEDIIRRYHSEYLGSFNKVMNGSSATFFNMFVMRKSLFDEYCEWLFDIFLRLEKEIDLSKHVGYQQRVFGFMAERLFNVWVDYKGLKPEYCHVVQLMDDDRPWFKEVFYRVQDFICYHMGIRA